MAKQYKICLDIGGTKILGVIFDKNNNIIYRLKKRTTQGGDSTQNIEEAIVSITEEMIKESGIKLKNVVGISACAPGVINQKEGIVLFTPNLPWRNYDIKTPMEKKFGVPFYIGNDVNLGVLGEYKYGAAKGYKNVVGFFVGTGMGGGLILNKKLFTGNMYKAAEYGHLILDENGPLCGCGQHGCLEAYSSKKGMAKYMLEQIENGRETMMAESIVNGMFKSKALKRALEADDAVAWEAVDRACHYLAIAAGNLIDTLSPDLVIFGGGVMEACGDIFMEKILAEVDQYCMPSIRSTVELKAAALGDYSVIYGELAAI